MALDIFAPEHLRLSTSPESGFVRTLTVQRPYDDKIVSLRAKTLREEGPGVGAEQTVLEDADSWAGALQERFGIDPDALGPERLERLWEKVDAQHRAYVGEQ